MPAILSALLGLGACGTLNKPLKPETEYTIERYDFPLWLKRRSESARPLDDTFVVMAFSGGGVRASALAYAVVDELTRVKSPKGQDLAHDIGFISAVSGGSVTAAQLGLRGVEAMKTFPDDFLYYDNTFWLIFNLVNPFGDAFILNPFVNRATGLQEHLSRRLYKGATFREMGRGTAPFVVLNASDMGSGAVFDFVQETFSNICSDLNELPVAAAVTASAAYPFALQPIELKNYSANPDCRRLRGSRADEVRDAYDKKYLDLETFKAARLANAWRRDDPSGADGQRFIPFWTIDDLHLLDGGLSDNLGVRSVLKNINDSILRQLKSAGVNNLIYIVVNARSEADKGLNRSQLTPNYFAVADAVTGNPINATTSATALMAQLQFRRLYEEGGANYPQFYPVQIDFDLLDDPVIEKEVKAVRTWWSLPNTTIDLIVDVGRKLLVSDPCFRKFVHKKGMSSTDVVPAWTPGTCATDSLPAPGLKKRMF